LLFLFIAAFVIEKLFREQYTFLLAMFFAVSGDFFFTIKLTFSPPENLPLILGTANFLAAYLCLIAAFQKNPRYDRWELFALCPYLITCPSIFLKFGGIITGAAFWGSLAFVFVLCYMAWRSACTIKEGYYSLKSSLLMALSGHLMLISDLAVGIAVFAYGAKGFSPVLENIIWGTFLPAWAIIMCLICEKHLLRRQCRR
jgi:hypothetical protein